MHRLFTRRAAAWAGALVGATLVAVATATVTSATNKPQVIATTVNNGGAKQWIAFDPEGRDIGAVQFLQKIITIVNTSNASNTFSVTLEPAHTTICAGTLPAGTGTLCGIQPNQANKHVSGSYFQVVASQNVLMGGHADVPVLDYLQTSPGGAYGADVTRGTIQNVLLVWQQGCPPRRGSGCPDSPGSVATGIGGTGGTGVTSASG